MNSILYEKEITVNAIDSAYEKGKKEGTIEELEQIKNKIKNVHFGGIPYVDKCEILLIIENRISILKEQ